MDKKLCADCQDEKELEQFHINPCGWLGRATYCIACAKKRNRERYLKTKDDNNDALTAVGKP